MPDMQNLNFTINAESGKAVKGLDSLVSSLNDVKKASSGSHTSLTNLAGSLTALSKALTPLSSLSTNSITSLATALQSLKGVSISKTVSNNLTDLGKAVKTLEGSGVGSLAASFKSLGDGLQQLKGTGSSLGTLIKRLNELPALMKSLRETDLSQFTRDMEALSAALAPLSNRMATVGTGFSRLTTYINQSSAAAQRATAANTSCGASFRTMGVGIVGVLGKLSMFFLGFNMVKGFLTDVIGQSNKYQEDLNLFKVAMGDAGAEAQDFAEKVSELMGIDSAEWMRNQGVFNTLITGFGVAGDKAAIMSKNLTQLGYDLSSFYNINTADALQKIQSGISGELEPLRRLGYDLSVAKLQQEAYALGIQKSVNQMTQAEKAQLRYHAIMTQVTSAQGDMARTIQAPANQLRVLQAQITMAARAIGNIFIPMLNAALPYLIAFAKMVRVVATAIASLVGFKLTKVNYDGIGASSKAAAASTDALGDATSGAGKKAKKAAKNLKKYNRQLLSFDRINNLTSKDKSSGAGGGAGGGGIGGLGGAGFDLDPVEYDFLAGLEKYLDNKTRGIKKFGDWVAKHIKGVLSFLGSIIGGFLATVAWVKIKQFMAAMGELFKDNPKWVKSLSGLFLIAAGAIGTFFSVLDMLINGISWGSLIQYGISLAAIVGGLLLKFNPFVALIGAAVGGLVLFAAGLRDMFKNGFNAKNITAIAGGLALMLGALFLIGGGPAVAIAAIAAGIILLVVIVKKYGKRIAEFFKKVFGGLLGELKETWEAMKLFASKIAAFAKTVWKVIKALAKSMFKFSLLGILLSVKKNGLGKTVSNLKKTISNILKKVDLKKILTTTLKGILKAFTLPLKFDIAIAEKAMEIFESLTGVDLVATFSGWAEGAEKKWDSFKTSVATVVSAVKQTFNDWAEGAKAKWNSFKTSVATVVSAVKQTFGNWADGAKAKWDSFKTSVASVVSAVKQTFGSWAEGAKAKWDSFKTSVATVSSAVKQTFGGWADGAKAKWESLKNGLANVTKYAYLGYGSWASGAKAKWDSLRNGLANVTKNAYLGYGGWATGAKKKWDDLKKTLKDKTVKVTLSIAASIKGLTAKAKKALGYANGGYVRTGQTFVAREAGPEMVGKIGTKSAVVNNTQIEGAIARSVATANTSQNALLRQLINAVNNSKDDGSGNAEIRLVIDGQTLGTAAIKNINKVQRQSGRTLLEV